MRKPNGPQPVLVASRLTAMNAMAALTERSRRATTRGMAETETDLQNLARLLAWYAEMGAGGVFAETPVNWRARGDSPPGSDFTMPARHSTSPTASTANPERGRVSHLTPGAKPNTAGAERPPSPAPQSPSSRSASHQATAQQAAPPPAVRAFDTSARAAPRQTPAATPVAAQSLAELAAALDAFEGCALKSTAKSLCLYRGAQTARLMVIGEAPGREEDLAGRPFVGPAGQLLDRMLAAIGLDETSVHITNVVYWRPPGNRTPTPHEALVCQPFLDRQIQLVGPEILLLLGGAAAKHMLGVEDGIMKLRGRWHDVERGQRRMRVMPTLHPAYLLRTPAAKRQAWRDLLSVRAALAS